MPGLTELEKVDVDLRACHVQRQRVCDEIAAALDALLGIDKRIDKLLDRRNEAVE